MSATAPSATTPAQIAKAALRRLATQQLEPTPEHYAKAYAQEAGSGQTPAPSAATPSESGRAWAALIERISKGLERGGGHWTGARKKQSLQRVLDGSRADAAKLQQRLGQLITSWDDDSPAGDVEPSGLAPLDETPASAATPAAIALETIALSTAAAARADAANWTPLLDELRSTLHVVLPADHGDATMLADALAGAAGRLASEGAHAELVAEVARLCERARAHLS